MSPVLYNNDCFGTHPNNLEKLEDIIKLEFILLYINKEFLNKFHDRIIQSIKDNNYNITLENNKYYVEAIDIEEKLLVPDLPNIGKLDINNITDIKYMIK